MNEINPKEVERLFHENRKQFEDYQAQIQREKKRKEAEMAKRKQAQKAARKLLKKTDVRPKVTVGNYEIPAGKKIVAAKTPPAPTKAPVVKPKPASDSKTIVLAEGSVRVSGDRKLLLEHLKAMGGKATLETLSEKMGKPLAPFSKSIKPLLSGLAKGGWVKM